MENNNIRECGILMPISSLHSPYGIGTLGHAAYEFADFLKKSGCTIWQVLPIGPTGYGDSPYQSFSVFAGNPYFIDLDMLCDFGLLTKSEIDLPDSDLVDYKMQYDHRFKILQKAFARFNVTEQDFVEFTQKHAWWLDNYALFMSLKNHFGGNDWQKWPEDVKSGGLNEGLANNLKTECDFWKFLQYHFYSQWEMLKTYCNQNGIKIVGDIPIYTSYDSADVFFAPKLFQLNKDKLPTAVAGCPPDAFSEEGQLWGNPLYDYKYHKRTGYKWWCKRIAHALEMYDIVRIDHFRGFESYYSIPYGDENAKGGHWVKGPDYGLFKKVKRKLGNLNIIAEDLGFIDEKVQALLDKTGFCGMKVLQFGFGDNNRNKYLPHEYPKNCICYTGTHDNQTTRSWFDECDEKTKKAVCEYLDCDEETVVQAMVKAVISSVAKYAVIPFADILELDDTARINTPSTLGKNWKWRIDGSALNDENAQKILKLNKIYGRTNV